MGGLKRLSLRAPFVRLDSGFGARLPMAPLRQPGCERARDDAKHGRDNHDREERRRD